MLKAIENMTFAEIKVELENYREKERKLDNRFKEYNVNELFEVVSMLRDYHIKPDHLHTTLTNFNEAYKMGWDEAINIYKKVQLGIKEQLNYEKSFTVKTPKNLVKKGDK